MRLPRMSGNAWVCTIIIFVLLASGGEQLYHTMRGDLKKPDLPPPPPAGPRPGQPAPAFSLKDPHGKPYSLATFAGQKLVLNFYCGCSRCQAIAVRMAKWQKKHPEVRMLGLAHMKPEYFGDFRKKTGIKFPIVEDVDKKIAEKYGSMTCPRVWVIDGKERVLFTNPDQPDMIDPDMTIQGAQRAFAHPDEALQAAAAFKARASVARGQGQIN